MAWFLIHLVPSTKHHCFHIVETDTLKKKSQSNFSKCNSQNLRTSEKKGLTVQLPVQVHLQDSDDHCKLSIHASYLNSTFSWQINWNYLWFQCLYLTWTPNFQSFSDSVKVFMVFFLRQTKYQWHSC